MQNLLDDLGVIILCPDCNSGGLRYTTNSIKMGMPDVSYVTMVGQDANKEDVLNLAKYSRVYKGKKTITSLIDAGMKEMRNKWCIIVTAGSWLRNSVLRKYFYFANSEKDILFPVLDRKYLFDEASINGILLSHEAYDDIGEFGDQLDDLCEAKLDWAGRALDKGYNFKAIVGGRLI